MIVNRYSRIAFLINKLAHDRLDLVANIRFHELYLYIKAIL